MGVEQVERAGILAKEPGIDEIDTTSTCAILNVRIASAYFFISGAYLGTIEPLNPCLYPRCPIAKLIAGDEVVAVTKARAQLEDPAAYLDLRMSMREVIAAMMLSSNIALFIDGANLYATAKTLGFDVDYKRLLKEFQSRGMLLRAFYYTAIIEDQEYSSVRPLVDWLDYNGYTVVTKATKEFIDANGRRKIKGSMDVELAVDAMEIAEHIDQMVLFSGDGDFRPLVAALQRRGVRVTVVSTISSQPPMIADELRRQADVFIDLAELRTKIAREPVERLVPREQRPAAAALGPAQQRGVGGS